MNNKVFSGADLLSLEAHQFLQGLRFGLLTNPTGITAQFVSTIQICANVKSAKLAALFACEHGIRGERQAGEKVVDEVDSELGIPVYSLYGETRQPTEQMLSGLDALVFDIQDLGVRFYTYLSTLVYVMEACAAHGKRVIVLDRPNPLGGLTCEGGLLLPQYRSMIGAWTMPIRSGMSIGEFARLVNAQMKKPCELEVIPLKNWKRSMDFAETGLPWVMPSPNMPTLDTVRVYPGNCLFEGTNLSEGRGTTRPFEIIGAPWLNARKTTEVMNGLKLPGVYFHPVAFTPMFSKYQGKLCHGIMTYIIDKASYRSVTTSLQLLHYIHQLHPQHFEWLKPVHADHPEARWFIDLLTGSDLVRHHLGSISAVKEIIEQWEEDCRTWMSIRQRYLLY